MIANLGVGLNGKSGPALRMARKSGMAIAGPAGPPTPPLLCQNHSLILCKEYQGFLLFPAFASLHQQALNRLIERVSQLVKLVLNAVYYEINSFIIDFLGCWWKVSFRNAIIKPACLGKCGSLILRSSAL